MAYETVALKQLLSEYSVEEVSRNLTSFVSINADVESFLKTKAIQFEKMGLARTTLVYSMFRNKLVLVGYFSISGKALTISKRNWKDLSKSVRHRLMPMGYKTIQDNYQISSILLGQLGINFRYRQGKLVLLTGGELLELAYREIRKANRVIGGNTLYLEADNNSYLASFYSHHGFKKLELVALGKHKPYLTVNGQLLYVKRLSDV